MDKIRVGVVGVGHLGKIHTRVYSELPQAELVAVADTSRKVADDVASRHKTKAVYTHRELFGTVDAASVAVPTDYHFAIAKDLIEAGIHVIVEKPITKSISEAQELTRLAKARNLVLQVGHVERSNPAILAVQGYINNPRFIECDRISPLSFRSMDIGVVLDLMIHDLDIILAFVDSPIREVEAMGVSVFGPYEDMASARISFDNNCVAYIRASRIARKRMRKIRFFQEDSYITLDYSTQKVQIFKRGEPLSLEKVAALRESASSIEEAQRLVFEKLLNIREIAVQPDEPLRIELDTFLRSIAEGKQGGVTGETAVKTMQIAALILESIKTRKRIYPNEQSGHSCR